MAPHFELLKDIRMVGPGDVVIEYPINGCGCTSFDAADRLNQQYWEITQLYEDGFELSIPEQEVKLTMECGLWLEDTHINKKAAEMISEGIWWVPSKDHK